MSTSNVVHELSRAIALGIVPTPGGQPIYIASGATVPTNATAGYAKGCIFFKSDGTTLDNTLYLNIGSASSCNFDAMVNS